MIAFFSQILSKASQKSGYCSSEKYINLSNRSSKLICKRCGFSYFGSSVLEAASLLTL